MIQQESLSQQLTLRMTAHHSSELSNIDITHLPVLGSSSAPRGAEALDDSPPVKPEANKAGKKGKKKPGLREAPIEVSNPVVVILW